MIFVFGSNLEGRHGAGAARTARLEHGAIYGVAEGIMGKSYALPTCGRFDGRRYPALPLDAIQMYIGKFAIYVREHPDMQFKITRIGCGLAGMDDMLIAPMFMGAPTNCFFDTKWDPWLKGPEARYWGTF